MRDKLFATKFEVPKVRLKENIGSSSFEELQYKFFTSVYNKAVNNLIEFIKEVEPNQSEENIRHFIDEFVGLKYDLEYDFETKNYNLVFYPYFKENNKLTGKYKEHIR